VGLEGDLFLCFKLFICLEVKNLKPRFAAMMKNKFQRLRMVAKLEGISFLLLLLVSMPLKYVYDVHMPNQIIGMLHGILFIWYVLLLYWVADEKKWGGMVLFLGLLAAILPFGTFVADKRLYLKHA
jgi:integral membrane protein